MNSRWNYFLVALAALAVSGCGGSSGLYQAGGTVTYNGAPLEGAQVTFAYANGNFASGQTDASGKYQLSSMGKQGASPGKCSVTVMKRKSVNFMGPDAVKAPVKSQEEFNRMSPQEQQRAMAELNQAALDQEQDLIPTRYADPATSGLSFEITTSASSNNFPIELKD